MPGSFGGSTDDPRAPLGHLSRLGFALVGATGVDEIARCVLADLAALPGVRRVGLALSEGGGRRLRLAVSDQPLGLHDEVEWCHIDAYDDVPLTVVMRTGQPVLGPLTQLEPRLRDFATRQPEATKALAAVPLPGVGSPIGGVVLFLDGTWPFEDAQLRLLEAVARRTSDAVRRVRAAVVPEPLPDPAEEAELGGRVARVVLEDDPRAAGFARRFLRSFLEGSDVPADLTDPAQLCLSELVTNAVVHAGTRSELRARIDEQALTVSVHDRGGAGERRSRVVDLDDDPLQVHGRGLQLVEALADRWGSERDAVGTSVWFALELDQPQEGSQQTG